MKKLEIYIISMPGILWTAWSAVMIWIPLEDFTYYENVYFNNASASIGVAKNLKRSPLYRNYNLGIVALWLCIWLVLFYCHKDYLISTPTHIDSVKGTIQIVAAVISILIGIFATQLVSLLIFWRCPYCHHLLQWY